MKVKRDILYLETWHDTDPEWNYVRVELRRYEGDYNRCDFVLDSVVVVDGETVIQEVEAAVAHVADMSQLRVAIAKFDYLRLNHPAAGAKPKGSDQC